MARTASPTSRSCWRLLSTWTASQTSTSSALRTTLISRCGLKCRDAWARSILLHGCNSEKLWIAPTTPPLGAMLPCAILVGWEALAWPDSYFCVLCIATDLPDAPDHILRVHQVAVRANMHSVDLPGYQIRQNTNWNTFTVGFDAHLGPDPKPLLRYRI